MAWPVGGVRYMIMARLSLKLSLNNPSNVWHYSMEICYKNDRVRERNPERKSERKRKERNKERKKERERASMAPQAAFLSLYLPVWLVYAKFHGLWCALPCYRFWGGPITLQCLVHISEKNSSNTKVVFKHFDSDSCVYSIYVVYTHVFYVCTYLNTYNVCGHCRHMLCPSKWPGIDPGGTCQVAWLDKWFLAKAHAMFAISAGCIPRFCCFWMWSAILCGWGMRRCCGTQLL